MRRRAAKAAAALSALALLLGIAVLAGGVLAAFTSTNANSANSVSAAPDFTAPSASRTVIGKAEGGTPGFIKQGGTFFVYAEVTDTGNPASGVSTVTSNTATITTGATSTSLAGGAFSTGGLSYNRRTVALTANGSLAEGTYSYSLTSADAAGNARTQAGFTVTLDNTAPSGSDVQSANTSGGTVGRAQAGDTITFTFSEPIDPDSILSGWTGTATSCVVRITNGLILLGMDSLQVFDAADSAALPFGTVDLARADYVGGLLGGEIARFGATGTPSSMSQSGNSINITLGTASDQAATTAGGNSQMQWSPASGPTDRAGNPLSTGSVSESGGGDKEF